MEGWLETRNVIISSSALPETTMKIVLMGAPKVCWKETSSHLTIPRRILTM